MTHWDITPCSLVGNANVSEEHIASSFRVNFNSDYHENLKPHQGLSGNKSTVTLTLHEAQSELHQLS
jgi:hypothetical protein